ncbi:hypothetical protein K488DRAFT_77807 [Vararia minispora EC-137]|uniref:Uncharacterized protein n=1 Tax=Vararia minispora EC-137 TaxID=1314806 RepID=A0ACB8QQG7_9AGAM|nr:hypothetical protein K488DRAFT_77807 [Vararia minispora EC-137]
MAEAKTSVANKLAMSRALGAAFLTHQVEQLEKTVQNTEARTYSWRDRDNNQCDRKQIADRDRTGRAAFATAPKRTPAPVGGIRVATKGVPPSVRQNASFKTHNVDETRELRGAKEAKQADIIVLDASVLVHALNQVKKWCRDGQDEILIVPLEALNTLDLLKKGVSTLAQRARAASRVLEAQVGTNSRVRVQRDQAFVLWDTINFTASDEAAASPEWVRRTICCAQWEAVHATEEVPDAPAELKVVLAALAQPPLIQGPRAPSPQVAASPVPLPAPQASKHEPRSAGVLVSHWARRAGLEVLELTPMLVHEPQGRTSSEEEREQKSGNRRGGPHGGGGRRRNVTAPAGNGSETSRGLVERPPAVKAMMDVVAQPSKVVRVLARGEKLEP